jgi:tetratricopeptide (TPR) repeat protein
MYYYFSGYAALKQGARPEAIAAFKEALSHSPPVWNIDSFEDCLARAYLIFGQYEEAVHEFERVLKLNPNYPLAHFYLAEAYRLEGKRDEALAEYKRFLDSWPQADEDVPEVIAARKQLAS